MAKNDFMVQFVKTIPTINQLNLLNKCMSLLCWAFMRGKSMDGCRFMGREAEDNGETSNFVRTGIPSIIPPIAIPSHSTAVLQSHRSPPPFSSTQLTFNLTPSPITSFPNLHTSTTTTLIHSYFSFPPHFHPHLYLSLTKYCHFVQQHHLDTCIRFFLL